MTGAAAEMKQLAKARERVRAAARGTMDRPYFLYVWFLMVTGVVFVFSASYPAAGRPDSMLLPGNPYKYLSQHSLFVAIALAVMLLTSIVPPTVMRRSAKWLFAGALLLMALALFSPWGVTRGGAARWLDLPLLPEFQPSEFAKIAFILLAASLLARKDEGTAEAGTSFGWVLLISGLVAGVLLLQRDQGMATIFVTLALGLLLLAGMNMRWLIPIGLALCAGGIALAIHEPYRLRRLLAYLDLERASPDDRYHILNMLIAQARGGITGMGLGMNTDKWSSLPAAHTDSIFSVIASEMGLVGGLVIIAVFALLAWQGVRIASRATTPFGFYVAMGVTVMLTVQALAHVAVNTACMPVTGLTLPFISGGGTSLISASIGAGLVLGVSRCRSGGGS